MSTIFVWFLLVQTAMSITRKPYAGYERKVSTPKQRLDEFSGSVLSFSCTICLKMTSMYKRIEPKNSSALAIDLQRTYCDKVGIFKKICSRAVNGMIRPLKGFDAQKEENDFCQTVGYCVAQFTGCPTYTLGIPQAFVGFQLKSPTSQRSSDEL